MAVVQIYPFKGKVVAGIKYITNKEKTQLKTEALEVLNDYVLNPQKTLNEEIYLTSSINCSTETAPTEFVETAMRFGKEDDEIGAHHGWQSFPESVKDPELVHKIGVDLMTKLYGDRFQIVVSTHVNTKHLHNHFFINAVSFKDGKKFYGNLDTLMKVRTKSDELSVKYGLPTLDKANMFGKNRNTYWIDYNSSWRSMMKEDIDHAMDHAITFMQFKKNMINKGYLIKEGKHLAFSPPNFIKNGKRAYIRLKSLNDYRYTSDYIKGYFNEIDLLDKKPEINTVKIIRKPYRYTKKRVPAVLIPYSKKLWYVAMVRKSKPRHSIKKTNYYQKLADNISKEVRFIYDNNIKTKEDLQNCITELKDEKRTLEKEKKILSSKIEINSMDNDPKINTIKIKIKNVNEKIKIAKRIENTKEEKVNKKDKINAKESEGKRKKAATFKELEEFYKKMNFK